MDNIKLEEAKRISGWLEKKSPSLFGGYQRRFFSISDGKYLIYIEKLGEKPKGIIPLEGSKILSDDDKFTFKLILPDREFILKTPSPEDKIKWITNLQILIDSITQSKTGLSREENEESRKTSNTVSNKKQWKIENMDKEAYMDLQKCGIVNNPDIELAKKCLNLKGISKHLSNIKKEILEPRIYHSFLRHKSKVENLQKRWFFIISSRPLTDFGYDNDDFTLEDRVLPSFLIFDTLYFYECVDENDSSEVKGNYSLIDCDAIEKIDELDKYTILMDLGDKKVELISNVRGERDIWFDTLKNSRRTAKEIHNSITKKPKNLSRFLNIIEKEGLDMIKEICEKDKKTIEERFKDSLSKDIMELLIKMTQDTMFPIIDSCIMLQPQNKDILKIYVEAFDEYVLDSFYKMWKSSYQNLSAIDLVDLGLMMIKFEEDLIKFGVKDPNFPLSIDLFTLDGKEFIKTYAKKTFFSIRDIVESILKSEREIKAVKGSEDVLITNGPTDLFKLIYGTLELVKGKNNKFLVEQLSNLFKETIIEYLIAIDYLIQRNDLDIDKEFIMAVANNSITINGQINDLMEDLKSLNILEESEIESHLCVKELNHSLNHISTNCIIRLVDELFEILIESFEDNFFELDINKLCTICIDIYGRLAHLMHFIIQKKLWNQVLNTFIVHYLKSLLTTANKKIKNIIDLKNKLFQDKEIFSSFFENQIGKNSTEETLRIIHEFLNFINSESDMIGINCKTLRDFCGPSFTLNTAKTLINLRTDFDKQTRSEAISSCKLMLENIAKNPTQSEKNVKHNALFDLIEKDIKLKEEEEKEKKDSYSQNIQSLVKKKTIALSTFLKLESESDKSEEAMEKKELIFIKRHADSVVDHDMTIFGYMKKKSNNRWQNRYFTLKKAILYWYLDNKSTEAQNFFHLKDIQKIHSHKEKKFEIIVNDKSYKFECESDEKRDQWVKEITNERNKLKGKETNKKNEIIYEVKLKKRIINDLYNLPHIFGDKLYMKNKVEQALLIEKNFELKPQILSKEQKDNILEPNKSLTSKNGTFEEEKPRLDSNSSMISHNSSLKATTVSPLALQLLEENKIKREKKNPFSACLNWFSGLCKKKTQD